MARPRSTAIDEALPGTEDGGEGSSGARGAKKSSGGQGEPQRPTLELPTERSKPSGRLEDKTITLYGPPKIGKSTLVSEFGNVLFFDTEGGLEDLEVYKVPAQGHIGDWLMFLDACALAAQNVEKHPIVAIDTLDRAALYCSVYMNAKMGVVHESDLEWGKGWAVVRAEMERVIAKLAATPGLGLILISHAKEVEIKQRNRTITKAVPDLPKFARDIALGISDLILYVEYEVRVREDGEGEEEVRVIRTKPSAFHEAGERGKNPRLPATLDWPLGAGYEALKEAWYGAD